MGNGEQPSLWLEILQHAAAGKTLEAQQLLNFDLPLTLRYPALRSGGEWRYTGPVPKIVRIFIASLPEADRGMAKSRADDFVDYITDLIVAKVRRTASLIQFGREFPELSVEQIAEKFTGWDGRKLGKGDRLAWVQKHLRSMSSTGITITSVATDEACTVLTEDNENYCYHELALVSKWRTDLSWKDFKAQEEIDSSYISAIDSESDSEEEPGVSEEAFDYTAVTATRAILNLTRTRDLSVDLYRLGEQLTLDLLNLVEAFHHEKPSDGYLPIAWHNVWWTLVSKYEGLRLDLSQRDPFCDIDRTLAEYIANTYQDVLKPTRLNIFRRRTKFEDKCLARVEDVLDAWKKPVSEL
jgi:hypothetical protein